MKLMIGIPAYNESTTIGNVLKSIPQKISGINSVDIVVIDDGSTDTTAQMAKLNKAIVIKHLINRGLGGALKTIFAYATHENYDILVTFDADGQHLASDIYRIIDPILKKRTNIVIGSRWKSKNSIHFIRRIINQIANIATYLFFGVWTTDSQSGFRAFDNRAIHNVNIQGDGMDVSSEFFKEIYRNKLMFEEIAIKPIYTVYSRQKGQQLSNGPFVLFQLIIKFLK